MRDYLDKWVTSPTWGPLPQCRQALNEAVDAAFIWLRAQTPITAQLQIEEKLTGIQPQTPVSNHPHHLPPKKLKCTKVVLIIT